MDITATVVYWLKQKCSEVPYPTIISKHPHALNKVLCLKTFWYTYFK